MRSRIRVVAGTATVTLMATGFAVMGAAPPRPRPPPAVAGSDGFNAGDPIESTTPAYDISSGPAAWTDDTKAPARSRRLHHHHERRQHRRLHAQLQPDLQQDPEECGACLRYGVLLLLGERDAMAAPLTNPFNIPAGQVQAGTTLNGTFPITSSGTNTVRFDKVIYDATAQGVRVGCNGQTGRCRAG